jgi:lipopolysaccharide transport system ATP-binding protein
MRDSIVHAFHKRGARQPEQIIWALRNVSFEIYEGEVVGVIGGNGAGKSTLLRLLSRITEPTEGRFELRGRVGSLLDVGTGFHPELTGRENIFLSGAILGMKKREIRQKFDEIVSFSELEKFLDTPLKHYSTGMWVRLGFAVAAHMEPDILLVDEVLAVGDAAFQKKCLGKIDEVTGEGRTVMMVSHNLAAVTNLCERCLWIDHGRIVKEGATQQVVMAYLESSLPRHTDGIIRREIHDHAKREILFRRVSVINENDEAVGTLFFGEPMRILIDFEARVSINGLRLAVALEKRGEGSIVEVMHNTDDPSSPLVDVRPGEYSVLIESRLPLMPGRYSIHLEAKPIPGYWGSGRSWDLVRQAVDFSIEEFTRNGIVIPLVGGVVRPTTKWNIVRHNALSDQTPVSF